MAPPMVQLYHNRNVNKNSLLFKVDYTTPIDEIKELVSKLAVLPEDIDLLILAGEYADRINELLDLIQN